MEFPLFYLVSVIAFGILVLFFLFGSPRLMAFLTSRLISAFLIDKDSCVSIAAIHVSPMGGKLYFRGLVYATKNTCLRAVDGSVVLRWWRFRARGFGNKNPKRACRLEVRANGVEYLIYNNAAEYDRIAAIINKTQADKEGVQVVLPQESTKLVPAPEFKLPQFYSVFPAIRFHITKGCIMVGNPELPHMLRATFKRGSGIYYVGPPTSVSQDYYSFSFKFRLSKVSAKVKENNDFIGEDELLVENSQDNVLNSAWFSLSSYLRDIRYVFLDADHFKKYRRSSSLEHEPRESDSESPLWEMLNRYRKLGDYAKDTKVLFAKEVNILYNEDVPGPVTEQDKDISDPSQTPQWKVRLDLRSPKVAYGPWADRQREILWKFFYPPDYQDTAIYTPEVGTLRRCYMFELDVYVTGTFSWKIPFRELSQDKIAEVLKKRRKKKPGTLVIDSDAPCTIHLSNQLVALGKETTKQPEEGGGGRKTMISITSGKISFTSSLNNAHVLAAESFLLKVTMDYPLIHNHIMRWLFDVNLEGGRAFPLYEHVHFFQDLMGDWTADDKEGLEWDLVYYEPSTFQFDVVTKDLAIYLHSNDHNIIDKPNDLDENIFLVIACPNASVGFTVPFTPFQSLKREVAFHLQGDEPALWVSMPKYSTTKLYLLNPEEERNCKFGSKFVSGKNAILSGSYTYYTKVDPSFLESVVLNVTGGDVVLRLYSCYLKYILFFVDDYLADFDHFVTTQQFQENQPHPRIGPKDPQNAFEVYFHGVGTKGIMELPLHMYNSDQKAIIEFDVICADARTMPTYQALYVCFEGPLRFRLPFSATEPEPLFKSVDQSHPAHIEINGFMFRLCFLFGPKPVAPSYRETYTIHIDSVTGHGTVGQLLQLGNLAAHFGEQLDDKDNALNKDPTFRKNPIYVTVGMEVLAGSGYVWTGSSVTEIRLSSGLFVDVNTFITHLCDAKIGLQIPRFSLRMLTPSSKLEKRYFEDLRYWTEVGATTTSFAVSVYIKNTNWEKDAARQRNFLRTNDQPTRRLGFLWLNEVDDVHAVTLMRATRDLHPTLKSSRKSRSSTESVPCGSGKSTGDKSSSADKASSCDNAHTRSSSDTLPSTHTSQTTASDQLTWYTCTSQPDTDSAVFYTADELTDIYESPLSSLADFFSASEGSDDDSMKKGGDVFHDAQEDATFPEVTAEESKGMLLPRYRYNVEKAGMLSTRSLFVLQEQNTKAVSFGREGAPPALSSSVEAALTLPATTLRSSLKSKAPVTPSTSSSPAPSTAPAHTRAHSRVHTHRRAHTRLHGHRSAPSLAPRGSGGIAAGCAEHRTNSSEAEIVVDFTSELTVTLTPELIHIVCDLVQSLLIRDDCVDCILDQLQLTCKQGYSVWEFLHKQVSVYLCVSRVCLHFLQKQKENVLFADLVISSSQLMLSFCSKAVKYTFIGNQEVSLYKVTEDTVCGLKTVLTVSGLTATLDQTDAAQTSKHSLFTAKLDKGLRIEQVFQSTTAAPAQKSSTHTSKQSSYSPNASGTSNDLGEAAAAQNLHPNKREEHSSAVVATVPTLHLRVANGLPTALLWLVKPWIPRFAALAKTISNFQVERQDQVNAVVSVLVSMSHQANVEFMQLYNNEAVSDQALEHRNSWRDVALLRQVWKTTDQTGFVLKVVSDRTAVRALTAEEMLACFRAANMSQLVSHPAFAITAPIISSDSFRVNVKFLWAGLDAVFESASFLNKFTMQTLSMEAFFSSVPDLAELPVGSSTTDAAAALPATNVDVCIFVHCRSASCFISPSVFLYVSEIVTVAPQCNKCEYDEAESSEYSEAASDGVESGSALLAEASAQAPPLPARAKPCINLLVRAPLLLDSVDVDVVSTNCTFNLGLHSLGSTVTYNGTSDTPSTRQHYIAVLLNEPEAVFQVMDPTAPKKKGSLPSFYVNVSGTAANVIVRAYDRGDADKVLVGGPECVGVGELVGEIVGDATGENLGARAVKPPNVFVDVSSVVDGVDVGFKVSDQFLARIQRFVQEWSSAYSTHVAKHFSGGATGEASASSTVAAVSDVSAASALLPIFVVFVEVTSASLSANILNALQFKYEAGPLLLSLQQHFDDIQELLIKLHHHQLQFALDMGTMSNLDLPQVTAYGALQTSRRSTGDKAKPYFIVNGRLEIGFMSNTITTDLLNSIIALNTRMNKEIEDLFQTYLSFAEKRGPEIIAQKKVTKQIAQKVRVKFCLNLKLCGFLVRTVSPDCVLVLSAGKTDVFAFNNDVENNDLCWKLCLQQVSLSLSDAQREQARGFVVLQTTLHLQNYSVSQSDEHSIDHATLESIQAQVENTLVVLEMVTPAKVSLLVKYYALAYSDFKRNFIGNLFSKKRVQQALSSVDIDANSLSTDVQDFFKHRTFKLAFGMHNTTFCFPFTSFVPRKQANVSKEMAVIAAVNSISVFADAARYRELKEVTGVKSTAACCFSKIQLQVTNYSDAPSGYCFSPDNPNSAGIESATCNVFCIFSQRICHVALEIGIQAPYANATPQVCLHFFSFQKALIEAQNNLQQLVNTCLELAASIQQATVSAPTPPPLPVVPKPMPTRAQVQTPDAFNVNMKIHVAQGKLFFKQRQGKAPVSGVGGLHAKSSATTSQELSAIASPEFFIAMRVLSSAEYAADMAVTLTVVPFPIVITPASIMFFQEAVRLLPDLPLGKPAETTTVSSKAEPSHVVEPQPKMAKIKASIAFVLDGDLNLSFVCMPLADVVVSGNVAGFKIFASLAMNPGVCLSVSSCLPVAFVKIFHPQFPEQTILFKLNETQVAGTLTILSQVEPPRLSVSLASEGALVKVNLRQLHEVFLFYSIWLSEIVALMKSNDSSTSNEPVCPEPEKKGFLFSAHVAVAG
eukprot:TRINITY_DN3318_c0_g1_i2.p1 TRINITY_DN3318_c0_g1~~TRINITY_DN3318_c0_g1_i2.p1  ORF type:complete len:2863 (-),score=593.72 TRINITY_DN3318_c0_g1_i2:1513-10071(-)